MNKIQQLELEIIKNTEHNNFEGKRVAKDLEDNQFLWRGVIMDRMAIIRVMSSDKPFYTAGINLIKLRDIEQGIWNADTLFILSSESDDKKLEEMAKAWNADEVSWISEEQANMWLGGGKNKRVLMVWWD